jgi:hypothetical protein
LPREELAAPKVAIEEKAQEIRQKHAAEEAANPKNEYGFTQKQLDSETRQIESLLDSP